MVKRKRDYFLQFTMKKLAFSDPQLTENLFQTITVTFKGPFDLGRYKIFAICSLSK